MPYIKVWSNKEVFDHMNEVVTPMLAKAIGRDVDWFYILPEKPMGCEGKMSDDICIEVNWFERPEDLKEATAQIITKELKEKFGDDKGVVVIFTNIVSGNFYENGNKL